MSAVHANYSGMTLLVLVKRIVEKSDPLARDELISRLLAFGEPSATIIDLIDQRHEEQQVRRWRRRDAVAMDRARDLTIEKFTNIPDVDPPGKYGEGRRDCRRQYSALLAKFVEKILERLAQGQDLSNAEAEKLLVTLLRGLVVRHVNRSCGEAGR